MSGAGHLGITVGNTRSVAVHRVRPDDEPTVVVVPTTLRFDEDGRAHLGEPVDTAPFTRFVDLVGRQEDLEPDADAYRAEDLMANSANCLVTLMSGSTESADMPVTTMTYPTRWPRESVALLRDALDHTGLTAVALVPDAKAASTFAQRNPGVAATVIDIGATGTDISTYPGGGTVRTTAVSGDVFTDALFDHVVTDREHIDLSDAAVLAALAGVVASCEAAKHALSTDEHATISVDLPGLSHTTTVTRAEFGDLVVPAVRTLDVPQTDTVVLTGGSAALDPVAAEIAQRSSGRLVVEPLAAARGALLLAEVDDVDGNSLVTGAAPIVTRNDGTDSLDTDAIPVVPPEKSLAFSEAIPAVAPVFEPSEFEPSEFRSRPVEPVEENAFTTDAVAAAVAPAVASTEAKKERSERSRTITTVLAGAAAGVVIVLAIAALSGVFGSAPAAPPPTVTDAGSPVATSTRTPSKTTTVAPAPAIVVPEEVDEPTYEPYIPPRPAPLPAPPPAPLPLPPPVVATTTVPVVTTPPVTTTPVVTTTAVTTTATTTTTTTAPTVP